jgi:hypothetical protein
MLSPAGMHGVLTDTQSSFALSCLVRVHLQTAPAPLHIVHDCCFWSHILLLLRLPLLLPTQVEFLQAYGLAAPDISRLLLACPELFAHCSIYESGRTLLFFKHLGYQVCGCQQCCAADIDCVCCCMLYTRMRVRAAAAPMCACILSVRDCHPSSPASAGRQPCCLPVPCMPPTCSKLSLPAAT